MSEGTRTASSVSGLTNSQALIWMSQNLTPEASLFNMAHRIDLPGDIDPGLFKRVAQP